MESLIQPEASLIVIFGAAGDLTWRKLIPALYNLYLDNALPEHFAVIGIDRKEMTFEAYRQRLQQGIDQFSRRGKTSDTTWAAFASYLLDYQVADFSSPNTYHNLMERLNGLDHDWHTTAIRIFYQATPPATVPLLVEQLGIAHLADDRQHARNSNVPIRLKRPGQSSPRYCEHGRPFPRIPFRIIPRGAGDRNPRKC